VTFGGLARKSRAHPRIQLFLKARNVDVEPEDLRREPVLARKFLCPLDTTLP
jgi:hypothetical protein